ncbi:GXWXG domain-containing protein, partial [uncultured Gordonia sp.]
MHVREILTTTPTTTAEALDLFDSAPAVEPDFMIGTWRGAELPTDHPLDGFLAASGWWGKQFVDAET